MVTRSIFSHPSAYSCLVVPLFKIGTYPQVILGLGVILILKISKIVEEGRRVCLIVSFSAAQKSGKSIVSKIYIVHSRKSTEINDDGKTSPSLLDSS